MKTGICTFIFLALASVSFAQTLEKGNIIIDPYFGGPNFGQLAARAFPLVNNKTTDGTGPFGLRAEYMLSDKLGAGLDYIYTGFSLSGTIDSLTIDNSHYGTFPYKIDVARTRIHARLHYHFVSKERVDAYAAFGLGANIRKVTVQTDMFTRKDYQGRGAVLPVTMRVAFGVRYYFLRHFGLNAELGFGGPLLSAGLSVKI
ncbi:MAG: outer membrane beta-barrel protein [Bacteroidota bacterium]